MKKTFNLLRKKSIDEGQNVIFSQKIVTDELLKSYPEAIQRHLQISGFLYKPMFWNADVYWKETFLTLKVGQKPRKMTTRHFISSNPLTRLMHMKIHGMPFVGLDVYADGEGWMKGKVFGLFSVINAEGHEITLSELITILCEFSLLNSFFLFENVHYESIDSTKVKVTLTDKGNSVSGVFHFDENGLLTRFTTDQRYRTDEHNRQVKTPFVTHIESYKKQNDILIPEKVSICWILNGEEFEYFSGTIDKIEFNRTL